MYLPLAKVNGEWSLGVGAQVEGAPLARVDSLSHQVGCSVVAQSGLFFLLEDETTVNHNGFELHFGISTQNQHFNEVEYDFTQNYS